MLWVNSMVNCVFLLSTYIDHTYIVHRYIHEYFMMIIFADVAIKGTLTKVNYMIDTGVNNAWIAYAIWIDALLPYLRQILSLEFRIIHIYLL